MRSWHGPPLNKVLTMYKILIGLSTGYKSSRKRDEKLFTRKRQLNTIHRHTTANKSISMFEKQVFHGNFSRSWDFCFLAKT